jgi:hypothetical protein
MDLVYLFLATAFWFVVFGLAKGCARLIAAQRKS